MKYLACPVDKCKIPLWIWGCEQQAKVFHCEHCWKIPSMDHVVSCPKGAEPEKRACAHHVGRELQ